MRLRYKFLAALVFLLSWPVLAEEAGVTAAQTELKKTPFLDAETTARLPAKTSLEILKRQGAWMEIKTADGKRGWVRMLNVRLGTGAGTKGDSLGGTLAGLGRAMNSQGTATTGIRGLSEEDLKNARPNPEEVSRMDKYDVSAAEAQRFAAAGGLKSQTVDYLSAPKGVSSSGSSGSSFGNPRSSWGE